MRRLWLRVVLVVAMLAAAVAASLEIFRAEQRISDNRRAEEAFAADTWALAVALGELRAAQGAYVSAGRDINSGMVAVTRRFEGVSDQLSALAGKATASGAITALNDAAAMIASLQRMDVQIREHVLAERPLIASDLIFTDTSELTGEIVDQLERARATERASHQAATAAERRTESSLLAGGGGVVLLVVLLLLPRAGAARVDEDAGADAGESTADDADAETSAGSVTAGTAGDLLGLHEVAGSSPAEAAPPAPATETAPAVATSEPAPDLQRAADLCTDLVRSNSPAELPALLARAAQMLNASGIIVWVLDGTGNALRPAIGHGYSSAALARIGPLPCDGDNATAAAWRDGRMHVVASNGDGPYGAIVAPLVSPDHCSGVLSLEMDDGWERSEAVQSTVEIVAAQLATLVSADPAAEAARRTRA